MFPLSLTKPLALAAAILGLGLSAGVAAADKPQPFVVATDDPANWLGNTNPVLDGVALLSIYRTDVGYRNCSGSLLSGGQYLLTAAHCVTDPAGHLTAQGISIGFKIGTPGELGNSAAAVYVDPHWQGESTSIGDGSYLAIVKLSTPVTQIAGYRLSTSNDLGKTFMMAGYGLIGNGNGGAIASGPQALHFGFNVNDTTDFDLQMALRNGGYDAVLGFPMYPVKWGDTYLYDFDSGNAAQNAVARLLGLVGVANASNLGLGTAESMIASGDSGGGAFVQDASGEWVLSAVHSYGWDVCSGTAYGGLDDSLSNCVVAPGNPYGSSFGSLGGSTSVYSASQWIGAVVNAPEPAAYALMLLGLAVVAGVAQRRARR